MKRCWYVIELVKISFMMILEQISCVFWVCMGFFSMGVGGWTCC